MSSRDCLQYFDEDIYAFGQDMALCNFDLSLSRKDFERSYSSLTDALITKPQDNKEDDRVRVCGMWTAVLAYDDNSAKLTL